MPKKNRLQQFIDMHKQLAVASNGFAHEISLSFIELGLILENEFDHKRDKAKTEMDKFIDENFNGKIPTQKELLFLRYPRCAICNYEFKNIDEATKDHIKPKAKGGTNDIFNLQLTCMPCNSRKGDFYDPKNPNQIVYVKNKTNVKFMLEQSNLIEGITGTRALDCSYKAWNLLWACHRLTADAIKRAYAILVDDPLAKPSHEIADVQLALWISGCRTHNKYEDIRKDHIKFMELDLFNGDTGRMGRILYNRSLALHELPLHIVMDKDKEAYFAWFKEDI